MDYGRWTLKALVALTLFCALGGPTVAEDGSHLWLRQPTDAHASVTATEHTPTIDLAIDELRQAWQGVPVTLRLGQDSALRGDGFRIDAEDGRVTLTSATQAGLLYAAFHLLRLQGTGQDVAQASIVSNPAYDLRLLNHWDNPDGTVERGYAGRSLWDWDALPADLSPRYEAYARANASIGINGTVVNNVNASPCILSDEYLQKVKALADVFRPYGIRVYLSVNFASPMALGALTTADPLDKAVIDWWREKVRDIYRLIPDFGGFLVKANSEGQPGPCDFGRTHAEGANMLADALRPYKGIVMWRAFVYSPSDADRAKQAYIEFQPLDGQFRPNVILQVKNGPIDFQPREPYSPLFGAMGQTPLMAELQITQEYLGHANHLAFLPSMWHEFFQYVDPGSLRAIAGVANIGTDTNWCGHPLAQANWYAFGRMAWDPTLTPDALADEWLRQSIYRPDTGTPVGDDVHRSLIDMMVGSRETVVDYMMPLGLHHIFALGHHYGPEPWCDIPGARADWLPSYYHRADAVGLGFDRSSSGSNAVSQYPEALARQWGDIRTCPDEFILWFHHVPWTHRLKSGRSLWDELCYRYDRGVQQVRIYQRVWDAAEDVIDPEIFRDVQRKLRIQVRDAVWWKDACLLYFQTFSGEPIPADVERPIHELPLLQQVHLDIDNYTNAPKEALDRIR